MVSSNKKASSMTPLRHTARYSVSCERFPLASVFEANALLTGWINQCRIIIRSRSPQYQENLRYSISCRALRTLASTLASVVNLFPLGKCGNVSVSHCGGVGQVAIDAAVERSHWVMMPLIGCQLENGPARSPSTRTRSAIRLIVGDARLEAPASNAEWLEGLPARRSRQCEKPDRTLPQQIGRAHV